jgi:acyl-CoA synthetase (AMP-forming)/AMP-acid ligase II
MSLVSKVLANVTKQSPSVTTLTGSYTTQELLSLVEGYENLLKPLNIKGKRVALLVPTFQEYLALLLAVNKLEGVVIPLNWQLRQGDLTHLLEFLDPHIIFTVSSHRGFNFLEEITTWASLLDKKTVVFYSATCLLNNWTTQIHDGLEKELEALNKNFICCTSGSTGTPKGLVFDEKVFDFSYKRLSEFFEIKTSDSVLFYLATSTIFGIKSVTNGIKVGVNVIVPTDFDLPKIIKAMKEANCNKVVTTPSVFKAIYTFARHLDEDVLENLELVCLTGEKVTDSFPNQFPLLQKCRFVAQYGISETGAIANCYFDTEVNTYTLCSGIDSKVVDDELFVRTGALFTEYYGNVQLSNEAFDDGWFKTGDLVELLDATRFQIVGRKKDMIKKGGQQVIPSEVEAILLQLEGVKSAVVVGSPHEIYGEQVAAFVVSKKKLNSSDIRSQCKGKIAAYKIPDKVIFIDNFPMRQGKVDKLALKSFIY